MGHYLPLDSSASSGHETDLEDQVDNTIVEEFDVADDPEKAPVATRFVRGPPWHLVPLIILGPLILCLIAFVLSGIKLFTLLWAIYSGLDRHTPALSLAEWRNGTYWQQVTSLNWVPNGKLGLYSETTSKGFYVGEMGDEQSVKRIIAPRKISRDGDRVIVSRAILNQQQSHVLLVTEPEKHWRHSTYANYWIMEAGEDAANAQQLRPEKLSVAEWNPDGQSVAYVFDHNVYLYTLATGETTQITSDGGAGIFNGIPDWVYEEEVFSGDSALWWSPKGRYLAYMRTDDSKVPEFPIPYFLSKAHDSDRTNAVVKRSDNPGSYPSLVELKYPKPGFANPVVNLWIYTVGSDAPKPVEISTQLPEPVIIELVWVGEQAVIKMIDREADHLEVWVVDPEADTAVKSRSYDSSNLGGGWLEITHNTKPVGTSGYVDRIDVDGFNHLAYFSPANASHPKILTSGGWEVLDKAIAVKEDEGLVFFHAARPTSMDSNVYYVPIEGEISEPTQLFADYGETGLQTAAFSPDASFATLTLQSSEKLIEQRVINLSSKWNKVIGNNEKLEALLDSRHLLDPALVRYETIDIGNGVSVDVREIRPTGFNPKHKHPLLFFNYGGPASKTVQHALALDYQRLYAELHNAVVVSVDPRGTASRGREFMSGVRDHLGEFEADDVIAVAKIWNAKRYIDEQTTAIWGWSYGGFLTLKVLERDEDLAFQYGVAVAPVTDWSLYDSIYTERYMHTPEDNADGYLQSKVHNVANLGRHKRFLVMHGTGDDNVHIQNTLKLLDALDLAGVENYDVHVFPDSDHSISFHNANVMVYDRIDQWLALHQRK